MRIVGILLAAGSGTRFGGGKLETPLLPSGMTIGVAACRNLAAALPEVVAVVRTGDAALAGQLRDAGAHVVVCARADEGMGASLACGVEASSDADGWVVALADMPWVRPATVRAVADAMAAGGDIVAPSFDGARGHPVGFARRHHAALAALRGDEGARAILAAQCTALQLIEVDDPGVIRDVDTPDDLRIPS